MPVILNAYGFLIAMLMIGPMIAAVGFTKEKPLLLGAFFIGSIAAIAADIYIRKSKEGINIKLIHPSAGGHIFFIPSWIISLVLGLFVLVIVIRRTMFLS